MASLLSQPDTMQRTCSTVAYELYTMYYCFARQNISLIVATQMESEFSLCNVCNDLLTEGVTTISNYYII